MSRTLADVREEAMQLSDEDRLILGEELLATVPPELGYEEAWTEEIERRLEAFQEGRTKGIAAEEVFAWLRSRLR